MVGARARLLVALLSTKLCFKTHLFSSYHFTTFTLHLHPSLLTPPSPLPLSLSQVHSDWLTAAVSPSVPLPRCPPTSHSPEMVHWMLQPSCSKEPELPWRRVHILCYRKHPKMDEKEELMRLIMMFLLFFYVHVHVEINNFFIIFFHNDNNFIFSLQVSCPKE